TMRRRWRRSGSACASSSGAGGTRRSAGRRAEPDARAERAVEPDGGAAGASARRTGCFTLLRSGMRRCNEIERSPWAASPPGACLQEASMTNVVQELEHLAKLCAAVRFSPRPADLVADLLAPVAACLRAESASFSVLSIADGAVVPEAVVSLGIPQSVDDAYLSRYCRLDPARRLLRQRLGEPVFP